MSARLRKLSKHFSKLPASDWELTGKSELTLKEKWRGKEVKVRFYGGDMASLDFKVDGEVISTFYSYLDGLFVFSERTDFGIVYGRMDKIRNKIKSFDADIEEILLEKKVFVD